MSDEIRPPTIVTLVHGTFDVSARWTESDSSICRALKDALEDNIVINSFKWSGKNSQQHRDLYAKQLADRIAEANHFFPNSKQLLIGHSHGGNIIKSSIEIMQKNLSDKIIGIITISTPFMRISRKDLVTEFSSLLFVLRLIVIILFAIIWFRIYVVNYQAIMNSFSFVFMPFRSSDWLLIINMASIVLIVLLPIQFVRFFSRKIMINLNKIITLQIIHRQKYYIPAVDSTKRHRVPYLCIFTRTDEVNFLFLVGLIVNFASRVSSILLHFAILIHEIHIRTLFREVRLALIILSVFPITIIFAGEVSGHNITGAAANALVLPLLVALLVLSSSLILIALIGIVVFGLGGYMDFFALEISYSMVPEESESTQIQIVRSNVLGNYFSGENTHTSILYGEDVSRCISEFVRSVTRRAL